MDKQLDSDFKRCMKFYLPPIIRKAQQIIKNSYIDNKINVKKEEDLSCHFYRYVYYSPPDNQIQCYM